MSKSNEIKKFGSLEGDFNKSVSNKVEAGDLVETSEVHEMLETAMPVESAERAAENQGGAVHKSSASDDSAGNTATTGMLKSLPTQKVMIKQVEKSIEKEIRHLKREARRMNWFFWHFEPSRYQEIISQIRHLCNVLASLAHATYDSVKSLWLKHVQKHV